MISRNRSTAGKIDLIVHDVGRMAYEEALELQRRLQAEVIASRRAPDTPSPQAGADDRGCDATRCFHLILVEHDPPVITVSKRRTAAANLIATPEQLRGAGVEVARTDRGGDITYHGPGQLVVYPILDLNTLGLRLHGYMRLLEDIVINTLAQFGLKGMREPGATGVWVPRRDAPIDRDGVSSGSPDPDVIGPPNATAKICAMGVRVSRWVSMHGLALNVTPDLSHFELIVPCGLAGRAVTSMQRELGETCPRIEEVKEAMIDRFEMAIAARVKAGDDTVS